MNRYALIILAIMLTHGLQLAAQSISLFDIDASAHPAMRAKFFAFDAQCNAQRPLASELIISEYGVDRTITDVTCPPSVAPRPLSTVLVMDVSRWMSLRPAGMMNIDLAKAAARYWINGLSMDSSDCAISSFDQASYLNQDFTSDRTKLLGAIGPLVPKGGRHHNGALLDPATGGLSVSRYGKNQRVIVFLTAGESQSATDVSAIVTEAQRQRCAIYCVILGTRAPTPLKEIAAQTGGQVFEQVLTVQQVEAVYGSILQTLQGGAACEVEWQTDVSCHAMPADVRLQWQGQVTTGRYEPPASAVASLEVSDESVHFQSPPIGAPVTRNITVTARNAAFTVTNITSTNPRYALVPTTFSLLPGQSKTLTLSYTAVDSGYTVGRLMLENGVCPGVLVASGGYRGRKPKTPTLKLTHPNGNEMFGVGGDTVITWEGVSAADPVMLEYSTDNGKRWTFIDTASGLLYRWRNVPLPASNRCLVRVRHLADYGSGVGPSWRDRFTLRGHTDAVKSVAFSSDGSMLASGSNDASIKLWNPATGQEFRTLRGHTNNVYSVAFAPDGRLLASGSADGTIKLWNPVTGQEVNTLRGHSGAVNSVAFAPDGVVFASGSADGSVRLWDATTGQEMRALQGHTSSVNTVAFSPDGSMLASACDDNTVRLWDPATGQVIRSVQNDNGGVICVTFSPDGSILASGSYNDPIKLRDPVTGQTKLVLQLNWVRSLAFSPDGSMLASASDDSRIKLWNPITGLEARTLSGHTTSVSTVAFSADGSMLSSGSLDSTVKLWSVGYATIQEDISDTMFAIVEPAAAALDVDMGQCFVGQINDSTVVDLVKNTGTCSVDVRSITIAGADAAAFSLVLEQSIGGIPVGGSISGELRFSPSRNGSHQAQMVIVTQGDTLVQNIRGRGVAPSLRVVNSLVDFGRITVGTSKDTLVVATIRNDGSAPIAITDVRHAGPNSTDFATVSGGGSFVLPPGETHNMDLRFSALGIGRTSGTLEFSHDGFGSPAIVTLFGEGLYRGPQIMGSAQPQILRCSADTTSSVTLINTGGDTLRLYLASITGMQAMEFSLNSTLPLAVAPGDSVTLGYTVRPSATGLRRASLELRTNVPGPDSLFTLPLAVLAERVEIGVAPTVIDLGTLEPGTVVDTASSIVNRGTLSTGYRIMADAGVVTAGDSVLSAGDSAPLPLRIAVPSAQGPFTLRIIATDSICGRSDTLTITGSSRRADTVRTTIALPQISTLAGQAISLDLAIAASQNLSLPSAPRRFTATIAVNPTVVHVTDTQLSCTRTSATTCYYTVTGVRGDDDTLVRIPAIATLGTTDYAPLELVDFQWLDTSSIHIVTTRDGSIRITGICDSGGVRLYVPSDAGFSLASRPNPAGATVDLHFGLAGAGPVSIDIIDQTGRVLMSPVSETRLEAGVYTRSVDLSPLSNGPYMLMLRSGNSVLCSRMDVVR